MADLALYEVAVRGHKTTMKLSADDAERHGGKKVGEVKKAEPQPVTRPSYANDSSAVESEATPSQAEVEADEKKAPPARNKARTAASKS